MTAHDRVVKLVERCNRDEPVDQVAMLRYLADLNRASPTVRAQERIGRRAIDRERLQEVLLEPAIPAPHTQLSFDDASIGDGSTLERKLVLGGFGQTTINAARLLRANWEAAETRWRADVPGGDPQFADLRGRVLAVAAKAERATMGKDTYGRAMHARIEKAVTVDTLHQRPSFTLDDDLLLGLVYELTNEVSHLVVGTAAAVMPQDTPQDPFVVPTARVLLLLVAFAARRADGLTITDVARIDFLLRHPPLLARAAWEAGRPLELALSPTQSEQLVSDRAALRVRYGPWDDRYRLVVGRLVALRLADPSDDLSRFFATAAAHDVAARLRERGWERTARHAEVAARLLASADVVETVQRLAAA